MTNEEMQSLLARTIDKLAEATYGQWSALLTINGVLITASSILYMLHKVPKIFALALLVCSVCSAMLLISNFMSINEMYAERLRKIVKAILDKCSFDFEDGKKDVERRKLFTSIALILLILEAFALLEFVWLS